MPGINVNGDVRPKWGGPDVWFRELVAGTICAIVSFIFNLSYAALVFSGPLSQWLAYGLAAALIATAVGGSVMALRSSLPFALASPDVSTTAITATIVASFVTRLAAEGAGEHLLGPALIVISLCAALSGFALFGLGIARAGRAVRFIPFPVIGGFLGAAGWLIAAGAMQVITGRRVELAGIEAFLNPLTLAKCAAGAAVAVVLILARLRFKGPFAQPVQLLLCAGAVYIGLEFFGISNVRAQTDGWMFRMSSSATFSPPWDLNEWRNFPWHLLPEMTADFLTVMFVAAVSMLLNAAGFEVMTKREADLDRELATVGIANLVSAALGGYVIGVPMSRSTLAFKLSGNSRIPTVCVAVSSVAMLAINTRFLDYIPKCVVGGLLLTLGIDLLYRWLVLSSRQLSRIEYLSLLLIALIIVKWGFIAGILVGIVISCSTFAFSVSRVSAIKFGFDGTEYRSTLDREHKELALLAQHGRELHGLSLQNYLFFGSANQIYQKVKVLLADRPECRFLLFDFRSVIGIDLSAAHSFTQIKQVADKCGTQLVLVNLSSELTAAFRAMQIISSNTIIGLNLDQALESCENAIIQAHRTDDGDVPSIREWLADALGSTEYADCVVEQCERLELAPGDIVARQGQQADSMHFILEGRVDVIVNLDDGRSVRVRSLGRHTTIGEMGLITSRPRSATLQAEVASVLYMLSATAFEHIRNENPSLGQALLTFVVEVMAERLSYTNRAIGLLQR